MRLTARPGTGTDVDELLAAVLQLCAAETCTEASLVARFGNGRFAFLSLFADDLARRQHLAGAASQAISYRRGLFDANPQTAILDVLGFGNTDPELFVAATRGSFVTMPAAAAGGQWADEVADTDWPWIAFVAPNREVMVMELDGGNKRAAREPSSAREEFTLLQPQPAGLARMAR